MSQFVSAVSLARATRVNATGLAQAAQRLLDESRAGQAVTASDMERIRDMARSVGVAAAQCEACLTPANRRQMNHVAALLEPVSNYLKEVQR